MDKNIFALDIGTRKIVGLVMTRDSEGYKILAAHCIEHSTRAMIDGQIHDIEAVGRTIQKIKDKLEEDLGFKLETAAVAAAGRALKTCWGKARRERNMRGEITPDEVRALEAEAVQQAQQSLVEGEQALNSNYFCVGYSVVRYQLEDQDIGNLVGQSGRSAMVEVIATFLPRVVVDSLYSALKRAGLTVYSLTLEPIAAMSVTIPPGMRLLNLAMVDVGAGTSDIAVVKDGNIFGYAMVPMGGDELTELVASEYLLDFNQAESLKREISCRETVSYRDILNNEVQMESGQIKDTLKPLVKEIAAAIANNILELNQKVPNAVLCVGGGSLTSGLTSELADALDMPRNRVGLKTRETLEAIKGDFDFLKGPQGVTPLGIAYNSLDNPPLPLLKVYVNGVETAVWNAGEVDIVQALLSSGLSLTNIYGRPGMGKTIELNGQVKVFKGELGTSPVLKLNGQNASLEDKIKDGDVITFKKGQEGIDAQVWLKNIDAGSSGFVFVNGEKIELIPTVTVNGESWDKTAPIPDRARVQVERRNKLVDILHQAGVADYRLAETVYHYSFNRSEKIIKWLPLRITIEGEPAQLEQTVNFGSHIEYELQSDCPCIKDIINSQTPLEINITVNGRPIKLTPQSCAISMNGKIVQKEEPIPEGAQIGVADDGFNCILSDVFREFKLEPAGPGRTRLVLTVDGNPAGYTTPIDEGSEIEIYWE